jgi:hypothetical protein
VAEACCLRPMATCAMDVRVGSVSTALNKTMTYAWVAPTPTTSEEMIADLNPWMLDLSLRQLQTDSIFLHETYRLSLKEKEKAANMVDRAVAKKRKKHARRRDKEEGAMAVSRVPVIGAGVAGQKAQRTKKDDYEERPCQSLALASPCPSRG